MLATSIKLVGAGQLTRCNVRRCGRDHRGEGRTPGRISLLPDDSLQLGVVQSERVEPGESDRLGVCDLHHRVSGGRRRVDAPRSRRPPADHQSIAQVGERGCRLQVEDASSFVVGDLPVVGVCQINGVTGGLTDPDYLDADRIRPEDGTLLGHLIAADMVADDAAIFQRFAVESGIRASSDIKTFVSPELIKEEHLARLRARALAAPGLAYL